MARYHINSPKYNIKQLIFISQLPMSGRKFGVKTSKTLRKCNWKDQAKELDAFVINHCAQYEG